MHDGIRKERFLDLIKSLEDVEGINRYRISSIEPNLLTSEIIEFVARSDKFVPHFHIPLQSGSNKVLKLMRRRYMRELYAERVARIKMLMPHCCIGVDVIVGFPGIEKVSTKRLLKVDHQLTSCISTQKKLQRLWYFIKSKRMADIRCRQL